MDYSYAIEQMKEKQSLGIKPGLERVLSLLEIMGNPQNNIKIIHVAGTNGKGTVAATIAKSLISSGYKTGLFTSPWVTDYREQIKINGNYIPKETLAGYIEKYCEYDATEFELLSAIMYKYFSDEKVDYAVVECGMGGLGDATNTEEKNIAVITAVSLDHTAFLGDTAEKIAFEKSGIIRGNCLCVLYPNPDTLHVFEKVCREKNAELIKVDDCGDYRINNLKTAAAVSALLGVEPASELVHLESRCERIGSVLLDSGHNVSAAKALISSPNRLDNEIAVIGMMADKDVDGYLSIVAPHCKKIITTTPSNPRSLSADKLRDIALKYCRDVETEPDPAVAVRRNGVSLVCGSFYLARDVRGILINMI